MNSGFFTGQSIVKPIYSLGCPVAEVRKEIKSGFGMDYAPSQELKANAVYFEIGVLAYNLTVAVKKLFLEESWAKKTIATLRWQLIFIAGKVIEHGRQLFLKIESAYFELLKNIRAKIRLSLLPAPA